MKQLTIPATEFRGRIEIEYEDALVAVAGADAATPELAITFRDNAELVLSLRKDMRDVAYMTGPSIEKRDMVEGLNPTYQHVTVINPDLDDRRTLLIIRFYTRAPATPRKKEFERGGTVVSLRDRTLH